MLVVGVSRRIIRLCLWARSQVVVPDDLGVSAATRDPRKPDWTTTRCAHGGHAHITPGVSIQSLLIKPSSRTPECPSRAPAAKPIEQPAVGITSG